MREVLSMRIIAVLLLALALVACGGNTVQVGEDFYVGEDVRARVVDVEMDERAVLVTFEAENMSKGTPEAPSSAFCLLRDSQGREYQTGDMLGCIGAGNPNVVTGHRNRFRIAPNAEDFTLEVYTSADEPPIAVVPLD
jgi:predicted small secreted protein